jgi:hypothetical protein
LPFRSCAISHLLRDRRDACVFVARLWLFVKCSYQQSNTMLLKGCKYLYKHKLRRRSSI